MLISSQHKDSKYQLVAIFTYTQLEILTFKKRLGKHEKQTVQLFWNGGSNCLWIVNILYSEEFIITWLWNELLFDCWMGKQTLLNPIFARN